MVWLQFVSTLVLAIITFFYLRETRLIRKVADKSFELIPASPGALRTLAFDIYLTLQNVLWINTNSYTTKLLTLMKNRCRYRFILSSGCALPSGVPRENVYELIQVAKGTNISKPDK